MLAILQINWRRTSVDSMDLIKAKAKFVIEHSLKDVIDILQSKPIEPDGILEATVAQIMNHTLIAHLSIERAMKFLIKEAKDSSKETLQNLKSDPQKTPAIQSDQASSKARDQTNLQSFPKTHDLLCIFKELEKSDPDSACFLKSAFDDAVLFFRYKIDRDEQKHFCSLNKYLKKVGRKKLFNKIRYWEVEGQKINQMVDRTSLTIKIHLEILHALKELFSSGKNKCVTQRVETLICENFKDSWQEKCYPIYSDYFVTEKIFYDWISHNSPSKIMSDAIKRDFKLETPHLCMNEIVKNAHDKLTKSGDIAILYFLRTAKVLPSQQAEFSLLPCLEIHDNGTTVKTPTGFLLGTVIEYYDGFWFIKCYTDAIRLKYELADNKEDAIQYLTTSVVTPASANIDDQEVEIHLVGIIHTSSKQMIPSENKLVSKPASSRQPVCGVQVQLSSDGEKAIANNVLISEDELRLMQESLENTKHKVRLWNDYNIRHGQHIRLCIDPKHNSYLCSGTYEGKVIDVKPEEITLLGKHIL